MCGIAMLGRCTTASVRCTRRSHGRGSFSKGRLNQGRSCEEPGFSCGLQMLLFQSIPEGNTIYTYIHIYNVCDIYIYIQDIDIWYIYIYTHIDIWYIYIYDIYIYTHIDIWYIYVCVWYLFIYMCVCAHYDYSSLLLISLFEPATGYIWVMSNQLYSTYGTYMLLVPFMFLRFQSLFSAQRSCATHLPWPHTFPVPCGPFRWLRPTLPTNFWCPTGCLPSDFGYAMPARVSRCLGMSWMEPMITLSSDPRVLVAYL